MSCPRPPALQSLRGLLVDGAKSNLSPLTKTAGSVLTCALNVITSSLPENDNVEGIRGNARGEEMVEFGHVEINSLLATENLLENTDGVTPPVFSRDGSLSWCPLLLLTCALLMTPSHSEGRIG